MMKEQLHFNYDGKFSYDMGIINVSMDNNLFEELFVADRKILEEKTKGRIRPFFFGIEYEPLEFTLTLAFESQFTDRDIKNVANWLSQTYYKPFYMLESPDKIVFCMMTDSSKVFHNGLNQGYIEIKMRANSPFVYSQLNKQSFNVITSSVISVENKGNMILKPEMWITKNSSEGSVKIINKSNSNREFLVDSLYVGETLYFDNENNYLESDQIDIYRYDDFNGNYLELVHGVNDLEVTGDCDVNFQYRFVDLI